MGATKFHCRSDDDLKEALFNKSSKAYKDLYKRGYAPDREDVVEALEGSYPSLVTKYIRKVSKYTKPKLIKEMGNFGLYGRRGTKEELLDELRSAVEERDCLSKTDLIERLEAQGMDLSGYKNMDKGQLFQLLVYARDQKDSDDDDDDDCCTCSDDSDDDSDDMYHSDDDIKYWGKQDGLKKPYCTSDAELRKRIKEKAPAVFEKLYGKNGKKTPSRNEVLKVLRGDRGPGQLAQYINKVRGYSDEDLMAERKKLGLHNTGPRKQLFKEFTTAVVQRDCMTRQDIIDALSKMNVSVDDKMKALPKSDLFTSLMYYRDQNSTPKIMGPKRIAGPADYYSQNNLNKNHCKSDQELRETFKRRFGSRPVPRNRTEILKELRGRRPPNVVEQYIQEVISNGKSRIYGALKELGVSNNDLRQMNAREMVAEFKRSAMERDCMTKDQMLQALSARGVDIDNAMRQKSKPELYRWFRYRDDSEEDVLDIILGKNNSLLGKLQTSQVTRLQGAISEVVKTSALLEQAVNKQNKRLTYQGWVPEPSNSTLDKYRELAFGPEVRLGQTV